MVGYVSAAGGPTVDLDAVKAAVAQALQAYMVPSVWMVVDEFVRSRTDKVGPQGLASPDFSSLRANYVARQW